MQRYDLDRIEADAEKATKGPWTTHRPSFVDDDGASYESAHLTIPDLFIGSGALMFETDARHVANCDPQTILALVAAVRAAQDVYGPSTDPDRWIRLRDALAPFSPFHAEVGASEAPAS